MVEIDRLAYIRTNQKNFRSETLKNLAEVAHEGNTNPSSIVKSIVLPSSFTCGSRYMVQNYLDALALCMSYGYPDLFQHSLAILNDASHSS